LTVVKLRHATDDDLPFVFDSWLRAYKGSRFVGPVADSAYYDAYRKTIEQLISRQRSRLMIAALRDIPTEIFGYCLSESGRLPIVHWCYVKSKYRQAGIGSMLLADALGDRKHYAYTFRTTDSPWLQRHASAVYQPQLSSRRPRDERQNSEATAQGVQ
jgi:ribosomal protein S18 acetylase RimI-like enzyme